MADEKKKLDLHVDAFFGDGLQRFSLHQIGTSDALSLVRELQERTAVGPMTLFNQCFKGGWAAEHVRHIIRLGLIGGGKTPSEAHRLVSQYFDLSPIAEHVTLALDIMTVCLFGVDPDASKSTAAEVPA